MAGRHFVEWFMKKFNLSLRAPEATSVARLMAFNRENVNKFFDAFRDLKLKYSFQPHQIYNLDETGVSTVPTKDPKVITPRGKRRVVKISSAERGTNVTAVCCMNAGGSFVPPFLIFPRVRMQPAYMNNTPPGFIGVAQESGWMTADTFIKYLEHFIRHVRPSESNRILLLMDNHASHVTLQAVNLCRENYITLLGFPAHTSHRMQPLDVSVYGPFKGVWSRVCEDFLSNNPGRVITLLDIGSLFGKAYLKVATIANAMSGFRATGIEPFDSQIFTDADFEAAKTTDRDAPVPMLDVIELNLSKLQPETEVVRTVDVNYPVPSTSKVLPDEPQSVSPLRPNTLEAPVTPNKESSFKKLISGLPALPRANPKVRRPRKKLPSLIISSTPVKDELERKQFEKVEKEKKKLTRVSQQTKNKTVVPKVKKLERKKTGARKTGRSVKRHIKFDDSSDSTSSTEIPYIDTDDDMDLEVEEDDKNCTICGDTGKDNELWFQCFSCKLWAHAECTELSPREAKFKIWHCYRCGN